MNLTEATIRALQGNLEEAKNPENDEINKKITKSLNGSTKYIDDLKDAGLEVFQDEKGKVKAVGSPNKQGMTKADLKNSHPDTDYYNYMTKQKVEPEAVDTGAFAATNIFRNSDNFEKTIGGHDTTYSQEDRNGVSKAIPKKYKTGRKNYGYNPDQFPKKDYNGVASYEPLTNKELNDFKMNKNKVADDSYLKQDLDKAKAEYEKIQAYYDEVNGQVQSVRDKIAKSKSNAKTEARSHKEDNEKAAPRTVINQNGREVKTRNLVDVSNQAIGNNSYKNQNGNQYWGTTHSEYASKRNKTGKKNEFGYDVYLADFDDMHTPVDKYQNHKEQGELLKPNLERYREKEKRARNEYNKEYWKGIADNIQRNIDDDNKRAKEVIDKEKERLANRKVNESIDLDKHNENDDTKPITFESVRDKIAKSKSNAKTEARSHKDDNERVAPRDNTMKRVGYVKNSPIDGDIDVPKRAVYRKSKPYEDGSVWGRYDKDELDTYEKSTPDIERYKELKKDADNERLNAKYHNQLAKQSDDRASDIVRDKKLARAKKALNGKQIFDSDDKKTETVKDTKKYTLQVSDGFNDAIITLDINKNAKFDDVIIQLKNELYDFPKGFYHIK